MASLLCHDPRVGAGAAARGDLAANRLIELYPTTMACSTAGGALLRAQGGRDARPGGRRRAGGRSNGMGHRDLPQGTKARLSAHDRPMRYSQSR